MPNDVNREHRSMPLGMSSIAVPYNLTCREINNNNSAHKRRAFAYSERLQRRERAETSHSIRQPFVAVKIELTQCAKSRDIDWLIQVAIGKLWSKYCAPQVVFLSEIKPTMTFQQKSHRKYCQSGEFAHDELLSCGAAADV